MQFPVPQFIDIEDKIIGPFTLKQFGFLFGALIFDAALFRLLGLSIIFFVIGIPVALFAIFMAFGMFNGRHIYDTIPIFISYLRSPKVMVFKKEAAFLDDIDIKTIGISKVDEKMKEQESLEPPQSRLKKLAQLLEQKSAEESKLVQK